MLSPKEICDVIYDSENLNRLDNERKRYEIYNGKLRKYIETAIRAEFILQETVRQLISRIIPLNITQKIVNKLAKIYMETPDRLPVDELPADEKNLNRLVEITKINSHAKLGNRYFKLSKHTAFEPYVHEGEPKLRVLPAHTYTPISDDPTDSACANIMVKHMDLGQSDRKKHVHVVWSKDTHYTMNGVGDIISLISPDDDEPLKNPYGQIPIIYVKESLDQLIPIEDDDLIFMQIAICLLLTDLAFATKFQAWSLIWVSGVKGMKLTFNPNSVITLPASKDGNVEPKIGTIKPELDSDGMLRQVETLVGMLLTTKSLSVGDVSGSVSAGQAASGVAKILDSSESTEDRRDQFAYFADAEARIFDFYRVALPIWAGANLLKPELRDLKLSDKFKLSIRFKNPAPRVSEQDAVNTQKIKLEAGLTSFVRALAAANPDMTETQLKSLAEEITKDKKIKEQEQVTQGGVTNQDGQNSEAET